MAITVDAQVEVARSPAQVFEYLDDFTKTPQWNDRCVEVRQTSPGPRGVGSDLHYRYRERGRQGDMTGTIREYRPGESLVMEFTDKLLTVSVGFRLQAAGSGTRIVHELVITPKSWLMKWMAPMIRGAIRKQAQRAVEALRTLLG